VIARHSGPAHVVAFSPDGSLVVSGGADGVLHVWSSADQSSRALRGHERAVFMVKFSPDGRLFASAGEDRTVRLWEVGSYAPRVFRGHADHVYELSFDRDSSTLASASFDGTVRLWDIATGDSRVLRGHAGKVIIVAFSRDGLLASGGEQGELRVWQVRKSESRLLHQHGGSVTGLAMTRDGKWAASASWDGTVGLIDLLSDRTRILEGHAADVWDVAFAGAKSLLSADASGAVRRWDLGASSWSNLYQHGEGIEFLTASPDGDRVAVEGPGRGCATALLHTADGTPIALGGQGRRPWKVRFSSGGDVVAVLDHEVETVDIRDRSLTTTANLNQGESPLLEIGLAPGGRWLAGCTYDRTVRLWDLGSDARREVAVGCVARGRMTFSPDGTALAIPADDHTVRVVTVASGAVQVLTGHQAAIWRLAFSGNGKQLVSCSSDRTVRVWDLTTGFSRTLEGHEAEVLRVLLSPDGTFLLSAGRDGQIRRWDEPFADPVPREARELERWLLQVTRVETMVSGEAMERPSP
jgi:WD40 repeat protein